MSRETRNDLIFGALCVLALCAVLALTGCDTVARSPGATAPGVHGGPAGVLHWIALVASGLAGAGLVLCAIGAVFHPNKFLVGKVAIACVATLLGCQIAYWLADHLRLAATLAVVLLAVCALAWVWLNRKALEVRAGVDFDRDGKVGE